MSDSSESMQDIAKMLPDKSFAVGEVGRVMAAGEGLIAVELIARKTVCVDESLFEKLYTLKGKEIMILRLGGKWSCAPMKEASRP